MRYEELNQTVLKSSAVSKCL